MRLLVKPILLSFILTNQSYADTPHDSLVESLDGIKSIQSVFEQTTVDRNGEEINVSQGKLTVGLAGQFLIETTSPFAQHLVSNGQDFYTYDPEIDQVIVRTLMQDVSQVPILLLGNADQSFLADYEVSQQSKHAEDVFTLKSKASSVFEQLQLTFNHDAPTTIWLKDSLGQTTEIKLNQVVMNEKLDQSIFEFQVPEGVDLIDDR